MDDKAGRKAPIRLTRRGRIVFATLLTGVAALLASLVAQPGQAADQGGPPPMVVVRQGDTLWSIAGRHAPDRDRNATIAEICRLNGLDGASLRTGQRLVLPRQRGR